MIVTGGTVGLTKWIIDVLFYFTYLLEDNGVTSDWKSFRNQTSLNGLAKTVMDQCPDLRPNFSKAYKNCETMNIK